jgi:diguanylate cyclase (GGDEF)-like protein
MFDLDHFGDFNKRHGHQVGDEALAQILRGRFRGSDILARYGGEEFIVVMPGARVADAVRAAEAIRAELAGTSVPGSDGRPLSITVSAGCAGAEDPRVTADELIRAADVGLAMAKRGGRDRVVAA